MSYVSFDPFREDGPIDVVTWKVRRAKHGGPPQSSEGKYLLINTQAGRASLRTRIGEEEDDVVALMDIIKIQMGHDGIIVLMGYVAVGEQFDNEIWTCERL